MGCEQWPHPPPVRKERVRMGHPGVRGQGRKGKITGGPPAFVGNCRRDLLDHVIVLDERHLKRLMGEYVLYYHDDRTHLGLGKQTPAGRDAVASSVGGGKVISIPRLGGLHHRYDLAA